MKKIFVCNTPYQLLIAVHMTQNMFSKDCVDVILSDHFSGADKIVDRINEEKLVFHKAYYVNSFSFSRRKGEYRATRLKSHVLYGVNIKDTMKKFITDIDCYDEIYLANFECFSELLYNYIRRYINNEVKVFSYEDGYGALSDDWMFCVREVRKTSFYRWIDRKVMNLWYTPEKYAGYYVLRPDLLQFKVPCPILKINSLPISDERFITSINRIFNYDAETCDNYEDKVIYFEECTQIEGVDFSEDIRQVDKIARIVGKNNIIVKRHPRNTVDRFAEEGYKTNVNQWIPWEVILMNQDIRRSILIAIGCSSILMSDLLKNVNGKSIYLLRYLDNGVLKKCHKKFIEKVYGDEKKIYLPKCDTEMLEIVKNLSDK